MISASIRHVTYKYIIKEEKKTFLTEEHNCWCITSSAGNSETFILKRTTQIIVCSPSLHKGQHCQLGTRIPRILPCVSIVPLASLASWWQENNGPSGEPWAKGRTRGKRTKRAEQRGKCTKRTNLYFDKQNNYLHDFGGGFCTTRIRNGQKRLWVGLLSDANGRKATLALWDQFKGRSGCYFINGAKSLTSTGKIFCFVFSLRDEHKDTGRTKVGCWDEKRR